MENTELVSFISYRVGRGGAVAPNRLFLKRLLEPFDSAQDKLREFLGILFGSEAEGRARARMVLGPFAEIKVCPEPSRRGPRRRGRNPAYKNSLKEPSPNLSLSRKNKPGFPIKNVGNDQAIIGKFLHKKIIRELNVNPVDQEGRWWLVHVILQNGRPRQLLVVDLLIAATGFDEGFEESAG